MVSVVIPSYNGAHTLEAAVKSALLQTMPPQEVIVIDNASTDYTPALLKRLTQEYPEQLKVIRVEKNVGPAGARNLGWRAAKSEYISFLDADDTWELEKIRKTSERLKQGFDFICHWEFLKRGKETLQILKYDIHLATYEKMLFGENQMSTSAVTVSKRFLEKTNGFDERSEFLSAEDFDLWLRLIREGARVSIIEEPLGSFILYPHSTSASVVKHMKAIQNVVEAHFKTFERGFFDAVKYKTKQSRILWGAGRHLQKQNQVNDAFSCYTNSLKTMPLSWRPYQGLTSCVLQTLRTLTTTAE